MADLGICFTCGLYQVEVDYLIKEEWVSTSEDILWRRTKLGLFIGKEEEEVLVNYLLALTTHGAQ
jgi:glycerol-3-phosphate dehydrogenase